MASEQGEQRAVQDDAPYQGTLGRTRTETVQVWMPDGKIRALSVYVGVNAVQDAALAALARGGTLHNVADGVALAIPFTYHDPDARVFVLVVPEALRHRALALRAEQLALIAADAAHAVPSYVREAEVVIGVPGLSARIQSGRSGPSLHGVDSLHDTRESVLSAKERELELRERLISARELALRENAPAVEDTELEEVDALIAAPLEDAVAALPIESGHHAIDSELEEVEDIEEDAVAAADYDGEDGAENDLLRADDAVPAVVLGDDAAESEPAHTVSIAPEAFMEDTSMELCLGAGSSGVWLFVREPESARSRSSDLELLIQVDPEAEVPVVLVTLVFDTHGEPQVRRGVIDPFDGEQMDGLRLLAEHFSVQLVSWSPGGTMDHWATLHTRRESNVRSVLSVLESRLPLDAERWSHGCAQLLASPPPWRDTSHPFQADTMDVPPQNATEAAVELDELGQWLTPQRLDRVRLLLCVPDDVIDEHTRVVLQAALDFGLSLTPTLAARAIELGLAEDERRLVAPRLEGLTRTSQLPDLGGLEESVLRALWSEAIEQAARLGVNLSEPAAEAAKRHAGEREQPHASALAAGHDAALAPMRAALQQEQPDLASLTELVLRGDHRDIQEACHASERLSPAAAAQLFSRLSGRGDPVALDALLALLSSSTAPRVRAGAALALSARRAANAVDELALRVASEPVWEVFAAALGRYGVGSFRAITRALAVKNVPDERAILVLAHLSLQGAKSTLRAKTRAADPREASLAERALALASELKDRKNSRAELERQGPLPVFSELFDRSQHDAV